MAPTRLATLAVALLAALAPVARGDDAPAPKPPAPAPPDKPAPTPAPPDAPSPRATRHYTLERDDVLHVEGQPAPAPVEMTREKTIEEVARVVWDLARKRGADGKIEVSDDELAAAIKQYNDMGGVSAMSRVIPLWRSRIVVRDVPDAAP